MDRETDHFTDTNLTESADTSLVDEQREHPRRACSTCITAVPVDESGTAIGSLMVGHCFDVSEGGVKITLARSTDAAFLKVEPTPPSPELGFSSAVIQVLRRSRENGCFTYAGRILPFRSSPPAGSNR